MSDGLFSFLWVFFSISIVVGILTTAIIWDTNRGHHRNMRELNVKTEHIIRMHARGVPSCYEME